MGSNSSGYHEGGSSPWPTKKGRARFEICSTAFLKGPRFGAGASALSGQQYGGDIFAGFGIEHDE